MIQLASGILSVAALNQRNVEFFAFSPTTEKVILCPPQYNVITRRFWPILRIATAKSSELLGWYKIQQLISRASLNVMANPIFPGLGYTGVKLNELYLNFNLECLATWNWRHCQCYRCSQISHHFFVLISMGHFCPNMLILFKVNSMVRSVSRIKAGFRLARENFSITSIVTSRPISTLSPRGFAD